MTSPDSIGSPVCPNPRCIGGWIYNLIGMMIFPTNKRCSFCKPPTYIDAGNDKLVCNNCGFLKDTGHSQKCIYEEDANPSKA